MEVKKQLISHQQLFAFIITTQIGFGILTLTSKLAENVGHDGWITILISGLFSIVATVITYLLLKRYGDKNIIDINKLLYGKYVGTIFNFLLLAYTSLFAAVQFRLFVDIIKVTVLRKTPSLIITAFILVPTLYLIYHGLKPMCRYSSAIMFIYVIVLLFYIVVIRYFRLTFVLPVGEAGISKILGSFFVPLFSLLGFELLIFVYPFVRNKDKVMRYSLYANGFTIFFYTATTLMLTGFFGEQMIKHLNMPIFTLARAYRAPVIERLDLFFISLWFPIMDGVFRKYFYCGFLILTKSFNFKWTTSFILLYMVIIVIIGRVPDNMTQVYQYIDFISKLGFGLMGYICICLVLSFINKRGVVSEKG